MENFFKAFNIPAIMIICGTVLAVNNLITFGIALVSLGTAGAVASFSIKIQRENEEKEQLKSMYEDVKTALSKTGIEIPYASSAEKSHLH